MGAMPSIGGYHFERCRFGWDLGLGVDQQDTAEYCWETTKHQPEYIETGHKELSMISRDNVTRI